MGPGSRIYEGGFTYPVALVLMAALAIGGLRVREQWQFSERRLREDELLYVGEQYRTAIQRYYTLSPGASKHYPSRLEDLLLDARMTNTVRPLRRLYRDPISNRLEWGVVQGEDGGIKGVYSLSTQAPIKRSGFTDIEADFGAAKTYRDWQFTFTPKP